MSQQERRRNPSVEETRMTLQSGSYRKAIPYLSGIFLGVCIVFVTALLSLASTPVDRALRDAAVLFAAAIPILVTSLLLSGSGRTGILGLIFLAVGLF